LGNWSWKLGSTTQMLWKKLNSQKGYTFPVHCTGLQTTPHFRAWRQYMRSIPNGVKTERNSFLSRFCVLNHDPKKYKYHIKSNRSFFIIYKKDIWQFLCGGRRESWVTTPRLSCQTSQE
jgi:hypothetical protein